MAQSVTNILVVNSKGGCGKTTVATNLAAAYANDGKRVALFDFDRQASAQHWADARGLDLPNIDTYHRPEPAEIAHDAMGHYDICVFDSGPGITTQPGLHAEFEALLRLSDVIVVPILSSAWDIRAGEHFITQLMTQRVWRAAPRPIAVVGNRIGGNLSGQQKLHHFLSCLDIPAASQFRESPVYGAAGDSGQGIVEMKRNRAARKEFKAWYTLTGWINEATLAATPRHLPAIPLAASRADRLSGDDAAKERA